MADRQGVDGRVFRSATEKLRIMKIADREGVTEASRLEGVSGSLIHRWGGQRRDIEHEAAQEAKEAEKKKAAKASKKDATSDAPPVSEVTTRADPSAPTTATQITGLGMMIAEIRAVVIKELTKELEPVIAGIIDQRMGELVAREIRKALDTKAA